MLYQTWLFLRTVLFYIGFWLITLVYGILSVPFLFMPRKSGQLFITYWNKIILAWLRFSCGIRYKIMGGADKAQGTYVVVANHQSSWETFFLQIQFYPLTTVLKKQLLNIPFFGWGLRIMEPIAIDRSSPAQALKQVKRMGIERLNSGRNLLIFPEGTRTPVEKLAPFKRSAADIAKAAGVPMIAVAHDAGHYWRNKKFIKYPGTIHVTISEPIHVDDKDTKTVMADIQNWVNEQINSTPIDQKAA